MKTFVHLVLTAIISAIPAGTFAQPAVPPPAPPPPPGALPPPPPPPPGGEGRSDRPRETPPLPRQRPPDTDRRASDVGREEPPVELRDTHNPDHRSRAQAAERERRRGPWLDIFSRGKTFKPTPYLGVVTAPVSPVVAAQLGLKDGFGLAVNEVLPGSPAAAAGMQKHDVLKLFNDQQLVDPHQFATLVRSIGKDQEATVTLLRQGQEQKITVKLGERMLPERPAAAGDPSLPTGVPTLKSRWEAADHSRSLPEGELRVHPPEMQPFRQKMREYQDEMQRFQQRLREWQKNPKSEMPAPPPVPTLEAATGQPLGPHDLLREVRRGGAGELRITQPDGSTTFHTDEARLVMKDGEGEIEMTSQDGRRVINIRDAGGKSIYRGPVDSAEQRQAVPEPFRGKIEKMVIKTFPGGSDARIEFKAAAETGRSADSDVQ